jgi:DNA invertase Pin-like site-specific DNA recombinase
MRAITLLRCSSDKQDLLVQQQVCRKFCKDKDYDLIDEIEEEDISGYKLSFEQRIGLLEVLQRAENKEFEILVVYMFDRLGRREDQTPFLIQKLYEFGVSVYTANDGLLIQADTMESKLMNYFQSWVANYESVKTSIRVKNKIKSLNNNGEYTGGTPPFGYEVYQTGEIKSNGRVKYNMRINSHDAEIVKLIFDLCINKNYGSNRIASYLNGNDYKNRQSYYINKNKERIAKECL